MTAQLLDGKAIAKQIKEEITSEVAEFIQGNSIIPTLAAVLVGEGRAATLQQVDAAVAAAADPDFAGPSRRSLRRVQPAARRGASGPRARSSPRCRRAAG